MQLRCRECGKYKPEREVQLGICDQCFGDGKPRTEPPLTEAARSFLNSTPGTASSGPDIILTTSIDVPNRKTSEVLSIVASECAVGINIFRDIANNFRDIFGGRSATTQKVLKEAREVCLSELKSEASAMGADAVIAVNISYNELSTSGAGGGILFIAAAGTAVKLEQGPPLAEKDR